MEPCEILCGIVVVILTLYYYLTSTFGFWKSRGVSGPRPIPGFGNFKDVILNKISSGDYLTEVYNAYKDEPLIGIFTRQTPILIVKDLDLIKDVLIKDFTKFAHRGLLTFEKSDPLSQHLFFLEPKRWRPLRMKLSPVFTSGKLKEMFPLISECADHLVQYMEQIASTGESVECRELTAKYTTDVIGSCAFGIDMNALSNEDSEFREMGRQIFSSNWKNMLRIRIRQIFPNLYKMLGYILPQTQTTKFFIRVIKENMDYRETNNIVRNDLVDVLIELKKHPDKLGDIVQNLENPESMMIYYVMLRGVDKFQAEYNSYPGEFDDQVEPDIVKLKTCLTKLLSEWGCGPLAKDDYVHEVCRFGGAELHSVSAYLGALAAHETIKLITNQYKPIHNTFIHDAVTSNSGMFFF